MSFGVVQSAISSIKYNKSLLSKKNKLKNTLSGRKSKKFESKSSDATDYELKKLRDKLKLEHKQIRVKQFLAVTLVMLILLAVFIYYF